MIEIIILLFLLLFGISPSTSPPPAPVASATSTAVFNAQPGTTPEQLQAAVDVLNKRLQTLGVDAVARRDTGIIIVDLPASADLARITALLSQLGYLELVDFSSVQYSSEYTDKLIWTTGQAARMGAMQPVSAQLDPQTGQPFETVIDGTMVTEATASENNGQWLIQVTFTEAGSAVLAQYTHDHIGKALAIVIDGQVISAPIIQAEISGGQAVIQGSFTEQQARDLAAQIGAGPLPIALQLSHLG